MTITKTTINMARRRGIAISIWENDETRDGKTTVEFVKMDDDGEAFDEYHAAYDLADDGLFFVGSCVGNTEDWPRWIENEQHLRNLLDAMSAEMN